jgi:hypothetical protein
MTHTDRLIGQLQEFKSWAKYEFEDLRKNQLMLIAKMDRINKDRWTIYGKMSIINGILVLILEIFAHSLFN